MIQVKGQKPWAAAVIATATIHYNLQHYNGIARKGRRKVGWSVRDTAKVLGISPASISLAVKLYDAILKDPNIAIMSKRSALRRLR